MPKGKFFQGEEAKKLGLVDEIAGLWEAGRRIHKDLELEEEFDLRFIKQKDKVSFIDILQNVDESLSYVKALIKSGFKPMMLFNY
jgi:protease-4